MSTMEAVRIGFRITRRNTRIGGVESLWRTAFAILIVLFVLLGTGFFLQNVTLSNFEIQAIRSKVPVLVSLTVQRLLMRHGRDILNLGLFVILMSAVMWWLFASVFRPVVVGMLVQALRHERESSTPDEGANQTLSKNSPRESSSALVRVYFPRMGLVNFNFIFFTGLAAVLSVGVFWGSLQLAAWLGPSIGSLLFVVCVTLGWTMLFLIWAILDVVTDLAQIGIGLEELSFTDAIRRSARILQKSLGVIIGITLVIFLLRVVIGIVFGVVNLMTNFLFGATLPSLVVPVTAVLWFAQSILLYYLYVANLASFAALFHPSEAGVLNQIPIAGKIIYEH